MWLGDAEQSPLGRSHKLSLPMPLEPESDNNLNQSQPLHQWSEQVQFRKKSNKNMNEQSLNKHQGRYKNSRKQIIETDIAKVSYRSKIRRGKEKETSNLSKFLFGIFKKIFQVLLLTHRLNQQQVIAYKSFLKSKGKLKSYQTLMKHQIFVKIFRNEVESSKVVRKVFRSKKMTLQNKLVNIRSIGESSVKRWKLKCSFAT